MSQVPKRAPRPLAKPSGWLSWVIAGGLVRVLGALGTSGRARLARVLGRLIWALRIRRRVALDNLHHAFPDAPSEQLEAIARGAYQNMTLAALESVAGHQLSPEALEAAVVVEDWGSLKAILDAHRGVLVASAHFGSWELLAEVMTRRGYSVNAVVRPLEGSFNARIVEARKLSGMKLIAARGALQGILRGLKAGEPVVMLLDQSIPAAQGVFVPFFGRPASTSPALALAALRTGAPVFVVLAAREGERLRMFVEGPIAPPPETEPLDARIQGLTASVVAVLERYIRRYPDQWLWLHRRWKESPPPTRP